MIFNLIYDSIYNPKLKDESESEAECRKRYDFRCFWIGTVFYTIMGTAFLVISLILFPFLNVFLILGIVFAVPLFGRNIIPLASKDSQDWVIGATSLLRITLMLLAWVEDIALSPFKIIYYCLLKAYTDRWGKSFDDIIYCRAAYGALLTLLGMMGILIPVLLLCNPFSGIPLIGAIFIAILITTIVAKIGEMVGKYSGARRAEQWAINCYFKPKREACITHFPKQGNEEISKLDGKYNKLDSKYKENSISTTSRQASAPITERTATYFKSSYELLKTVLAHAVLPQKEKVLSRGVIFKDNLTRKEKDHYIKKFNVVYYLMNTTTGLYPMWALDDEVFEDNDASKNSDASENSDSDASEDYMVN